MSITFNPFTGTFDFTSPAGSGGVTAVSAFGSSPNAAGASISGGTLTLQPASAAFPGGVSTTTQTFSGQKTFNGLIIADGGIDTTLGGTLALGTTNASIINIGHPSATVNIQGDVNIINVTDLDVTNKVITLNVGGPIGSASNSGIEIEENAVITGYVETSANRNSWIFLAPNTAGVVTLTPGAVGFTIDQGSHDPVTIGTANGLSIVGQVLSLDLSSTSTTGALSSTDWNTFNDKQDAGDYITELTGDVTAVGPGSVVATIANDAVTFAKMQDIATSRLLGRSTAGTGNIEEISLGSGLSLTSGILNTVNDFLANSIQVYLDAEVGDDGTADGTPAKPFETLPALLAFLALTPGIDYEIIAAPSMTGYDGAPIAWPHNVSLSGSARGTTTQILHEITFTADPGENKFVFTNVTVTDLTLDLSAASVCVAILAEGNYSFTRTAGGAASCLMLVSDSLLGPCEINDTVIVNNCLAISGSSNVNDGGSLILLGGAVIGTPIDVYATGNVTAMGTFLAGGVTGHTVGPDTPTLTIDASSLLGPASGVDFVYLDDAAKVKYTPAVSANWPVAPDDVAEALDELITLSSNGGNDIPETSFTAADNQASPANVTGLLFANANVRSFDAILSIVRDATYSQYRLFGIQKAASWEMSQSYIGDDAGLVFSIDSAGQVQYTSTSTGFTSSLKFRAITLSV